MAILYRTGWIILMILVVAPGFIMAGQVDGISYTEATGVVMQNLHNWFSMPWGIAAALSPVVAFVAQLFPASSAVAVMAGEMVWEHLGVILTTLFFATIKPPFYAKIQKKYELQGQAA
ncbi:hypothetical protein [Pseudomonas kurunegalensis]|uniref:hypothetical protein n=1 Tax=Pseudomonas kurunegalensis TaxID=485880 RepID=UPI003558583F